MARTGAAEQACAAAAGVQQRRLCSSTRLRGETRRMWKQRFCFGSRPHKPKCALDVTNVTVPGGVLAQSPVVAAPGLAPPFSTGTVNRSGLNGLTACGTTGLQTGCFEVRSAQPVSYVIQEMDGLLNPTNEALLRGVVPDSFPSRLSFDSALPGERRFVVMDNNVFRLYGHLVQQYFDANGVEAYILPLPTNEANKSFDLVFEVARHLEIFRLNRRKEPIIAIGGGVCLDVAGLSANLYRRNTPIVKVPTTVMAAIDASVGIKTAVNFENKKNKLGTYCPPLAVFIDRAFLRTLDQRNISNGAAEMLKMACIKDALLFSILEHHAELLRTSNFQDRAAGVAMRRSIQGMLEELEPNLWEAVLCRLVDYGHTFSPELEMAALAHGDELLHGEAVTIDMALTTQMAYARGLISYEERGRVLGIMQRLRLPLWHPVCCPELFMKGLLDTTKARDGLQRVPLMTGIGDAVFVNDISQAEVCSAAAVLRSIAASSAPQQFAENNNIVAVPAKPPVAA